MKKVLITGSSGKIGKDLKGFINQHYEVIELEKNDKLSENKFKGVNAVIHLAALTPIKDKRFSLKEYLEINVELTKKILFYASKHHVKTVIIPTSWSWMFKIGNYQYSKLLQEKIADKYRELGLNIITLELPEVITRDRKGVIQSIIERIGNDQSTTVDMININTITTRDIAVVCKKFIEGNNSKANNLYKELVKTFDLYHYIKDVIKKESPDKLKYLKKGKAKIRSPIINKDKTIIFPDFEIK